MKYCSVCGTELTDVNKYCPCCGTLVETDIELNIGVKGTDENSVPTSYDEDIDLFQDTAQITSKEEINSVSSNINVNLSKGDTKVKSKVTFVGKSCIPINILSIFFPLIGLIFLAFVWRYDRMTKKYDTLCLCVAIRMFADISLYFISILIMCLFIYTI